MYDFRTFCQEMTRARNAWDDVRDALCDNTRRRDRYTSFDRDEKLASVQRLLSDISALEVEIAAQHGAAARARRELAGLEGRILGRLNLKAWIDGAQRQLRAKRTRAEALLARSLTAEEAAIASAQQKREEARGLEAELLAHARTDFGRLEEEFAELKALCAEREAKALAIEARYEGFTSANIDLIEECRRVDRMIMTLEQDVKAAETFERQLSDPPEGMERRDVHRACEERFGEGSPRHVINLKRGEIGKLSRDRAKLEARVDSEARRAARMIERIVIDGSNLCYYDMLKDRFIGLVALEALLPVLAERYEVHVIFDGTTRRRLGMLPHQIPDHFPDNVRVHVTARRQKADPLIMRLVENDEGAYIMSNDVLTEFFDKKAREHRRIGFELMDDRVVVLDLDLEVMLPEILKDKNALQPA